MPDKPKQTPKQVVQGCLIIIVLGAVIVGACTGVVVACTDGESDLQPENSRTPASADVKLTTLDRECLSWARLTGLRAPSFTEQNIRANYTGWMQNVVRHCSTIRPAVREVCREMESIGLNPRNRDDLYATLDAFGRAAQINEFVAAVEVWCD